MDGWLIAAEFSWLSLQSWLAIGQVALGLGLVIFVHELGHFLVAKACGVKCEKFYIGFDVPIRLGPIALPRALARWTWGETEYGIGIIPLGGYVKMLGQDDNPARADEEAARIRVPVAGEGQGEEAGEWQLDPRSFPAKTVPQRMAIISAGVIMNLITAVMFAGVAYGVGVSFTPCEIGGTSPGSPAWMAGLQPGDRIVQIHRNGQPNNKLRYDKDLKEAVLMNGETRDLALQVRGPDGSERWVTLRPSHTQIGSVRFPTIGVLPASSLRIAADWPPASRDANEKSGPAPLLKAQDRVVAVDGEEVANGPQLLRRMAAQANENLRLTVDRPVAAAAGNATPTPERLEVELPPNSVRTLGFSMDYGPITAVQPGSPAAEAGIREGDRLVAIAGTDLIDPMLLPFLVAEWYGKEMPLEIERPSASGKPERVGLTLTPRAPDHYAESPSFAGSDALGIAFRVFNVVAHVEEGSPAAAAGMRTGDVVVEVTLVGAAKGSGKGTELKPLGSTLAIDDKNFNWPYAFQTVQDMKPDTFVRLALQRGDERKVVDVAPVPTMWNNPDRHLFLGALQEVHEAANWQEALSLGFRETYESARKVLAFLQRLVTGEISPTNLGGPGTIAVVATSEASKGTPNLLIFLTLLSANLAVVNFLPIPVLDGGHMLFLTAELLRGKPVDEKLQLRLTMVGLAFVLSLMVFVIGLDFVRFGPLGS